MITEPVCKITFWCFEVSLGTISYPVDNLVPILVWQVLDLLAVVKKKRSISPLQTSPLRNRVEGPQELFLFLIPSFGIGFYFSLLPFEADLSLVEKPVLRSLRPVSLPYPSTIQLSKIRKAVKTSLSPKCTVRWYQTWLIEMDIKVEKIVMDHLRGGKSRYIIYHIWRSGF